VAEWCIFKAKSLFLGFFCYRSYSLIKKCFDFFPSFLYFSNYSLLGDSGKFQGKHNDQNTSNVSMAFVVKNDKKSTHEEKIAIRAHITMENYKARYVIV
jgi:hypothetical protein